MVLQVNWHDFAFFDPVMYESLRQLIRHSQAGEADAVFAAMDLAFAIDLCKEEGAGQVKDYTVNVDCITKCWQIHSLLVSFGLKISLQKHKGVQRPERVARGTGENLGAITLKSRMLNSELAQTWSKKVH